jgi:hypothetical protein
MLNYAVPNKNSSVFDDAEVLQKCTTADAHGSAQRQQLPRAADQSILVQNITFVADLTRN